VDNITMDLTKIGLQGCRLDYSGSRYGWLALVNKVINLRVPEITGNSGLDEFTV
jgi:hypothetical protein